MSAVLSAAMPSGVERRIPVVPYAARRRSSPASAGRADASECFPSWSRLADGERQVEPLPVAPSGELHGLARSRSDVVDPGFPVADRRAVGRDDEIAGRAAPRGGRPVDDFAETAAAAATRTRVRVRSPVCPAPSAPRCCRRRRESARAARRWRRARALEWRPSSTSLSSAEAARRPRSRPRGRPRP